MNKFYKKKSLGQHFLKSRSALSKIISAARLKAEDMVLEIGPGEGVLTEEILSLGCKVVALEKDRRLIPLLQNKFSREIENGRLKILEVDALKFKPEEVGEFAGDYKIVANIPYYITGSFLEKYLTVKNQAEMMVIMVQREVAERITARESKESILSISVKAYGEPRIVEKISRRAFSPEPNVDSAILVISAISRNFFREIDEKTFFKAVKMGFSKKRKLLINNISPLFNNKKVLEIFKKCEIDQKKRAEDITLEDWGCIAQEI